MSIEKENLSQTAVKNSMYSISVVLLSKIGGFVFTLMLARLLLPELFGLYSLALAVVMIAIAITDAGADLTGMRYISKALGENDKGAARSYFRFLLKIKGLLILISIVIVLLIAKPLSNTVFNKPLFFLPLVFSCLYLIIEPIRSFFGVPFSAKKDLRILPPIELLFQSLKIILSLIAISILSYKFKIPGIFAAFFISGFLSLSLVFIFLVKKDRELIFGKLVWIDKKKILKYMGYMGLTSITLIFFGSIDILMLGHFVEAEYLGYYKAAFVLVASISSLLPFSGILLPIFTQIQGERLDRGFKRSLRYLIILAIPMSVGLIFISKYIILLFYGKEYLPASTPLLVLSILIIISPLISLYSTIFQARDKINLLVKFAIISLLMNIVLNYTLIKLLLNISPEYSIIGASIATLASNAFFLSALIIKTKSQFKIRLDNNIILKSIFATMMMSIFIFAFMKYVEIDILSGIVMIISSAIIYFLIIFLVKGLGKEEISLFKFMLHRKS